MEKKEERDEEGQDDQCISHRSDKDKIVKFIKDHKEHYNKTHKRFTNKAWKDNLCQQMSTFYTGLQDIV